MIKDLLKKIDIKRLYYNDFISFNDVPDIEISSIEINSKKCKKNSVFYPTKRINKNREFFIDEAILNGAKVVICKKNLNYLDKKNNILYIEVKDIYINLDIILNEFYDFASEKLNIVGITGTNGKTTTAMLINQILKKYYKTAYIGTLGIEIDNKKYNEEHLTTPDIITINKYIFKMNKENVKTLSLEVSSHSLVQKRIDNIDVDIAIFTNLTHDHLDYHKTMKEYKNAKLLLFKDLKRDSVSILNIDDKNFKDFYIKSNSKKKYSYGINKNADFQIFNVKLYRDKTLFYLNVKDEQKVYQINTNLVSFVNVYNLTAAIIAIRELGFDILEILDKFEFNINIGRFQIIEDENLNIIVDFAHTPDAFLKVYEFAKSITNKNSKIISIFGAPGKRDKLKRPILGKISDEFCDKIILTEDDYRDELSIDIANDILEGVENKEKVEIILDRYKAIENALINANKGDTILVLSKGLEKFIPEKNSERYWMGDDVACKEILKKLKKV